MADKKQRHTASKSLSDELFEGLAVSGQFVVPDTREGLVLGIGCLYDRKDKALHGTVWSVRRLEKRFGGYHTAFGALGLWWVVGEQAATFAAALAEYLKSPACDVDAKLRQVRLEQCQTVLKVQELLRRYAPDPAGKRPPDIFDQVTRAAARIAELQAQVGTVPEAFEEAVRQAVDSGFAAAALAPLYPPERRTPEEIRADAERAFRGEVPWSADGLFQAVKAHAKILRMSEKEMTERLQRRTGHAPDKPADVPAFGFEPHLELLKDWMDRVYAARPQVEMWSHFWRYLASWAFVKKNLVRLVEDGLLVMNTRGVRLSPDLIAVLADTPYRAGYNPATDSDAFDYDAIVHEIRGRHRQSSKRAKKKRPKEK